MQGPFYAHYVYHNAKDEELGLVTKRHARMS